MSRRWARLCILSLGAGLVLMWFVPMFGLFHPCFEFSLAFIWGAVWIKYFRLKCPHCGAGGAPAQWSKPGKYRCPKCGELLRYDDEDQ